MQNLNYKLLFILVFFAASVSLFDSCTSKSERAAISDNKDQASEWKIIGPGAGGGVFIPSISPFDTNLVFAKGDMTGDFVTYDGGISWKSFNLMSVVQDFEFDPADPNVVYAAGRGYLYDEDRGSGLSMLYRSDNKGKTWNVIYPDINEIRPLEKLQSNSFLPSGLSGKLPNGSIDIIKVDPEDNNRIYLGLSPLRPYIGKLPDDSPHVIYFMETENRGKTWQLITSVPGTEVLGIFTKATHQKNDEVTVITDTVIAKVNLRKYSMRIVSHQGDRILKAAGGASGDKMLTYIITKVSKDQDGNIVGGLFRSSDNGEKWEDANGNLRMGTPEGVFPDFLCMGVCEKRANAVYISVYTQANGLDREEKVRYEIYKSLDSGNTWQSVYSANAKEVLSGNFNDSWLNREYGPGWGGDILTLGVAPDNPDICYATDYGQMYKTSDGGLTWCQVCSINNSDGSVSTRGLDLTCCYGVVFDPFDTKHLLISYIDIGLFHSFDGGKSWFHYVEGIPYDWVNTCYNITFDPSVKGQVWSAWANKHSLPRKSQFGDGLFQGYSGGVAYSGNSGKSWQKWNKGLPENSICTDILVDPGSPENNRILYVSTFNNGVYKSTDNGRNWISSGKGLKENQYGWELRLAGKRIYLLCVRGWKKEKSMDGLLYYSDDQAYTWHEAQMPDGVVAPSDLLTDPENPGHMYLSCWPKHENDVDIRGGIYSTLDSGRSWKLCFDERMRVFAAAFDPSDTRTIYVNTFQNAAYRSSDSGTSWKRIGGYRFKWGHCPVPDPNNPGMLFLTTYGTSVYYGPAIGTQQEFGRIENIPDSWW